MPHIVIIGAGISGLALAYRLRQTLPSVELTVLEQRDRPGGTVWTERLDGFQVEIGPNGFLDGKPSTLALSRDLGLGDKLIPASESAGRNRFLFLDGRLQPLPGSPLSLLTTDLLSWRGKFHLLAEPFRRPRLDPADESIDAFVRRRAGAEAADVFADAIVTGIYAGDPRKLSVGAAFPRVAAWERHHGSVIKGMIHAARARRNEARNQNEANRRPGTMWSFRDGLRLLIETLRDELGPALQLGVVVRRIEMSPGPSRPRWTVHGEGQDCWQADAVVLTCPAYRQSAILGDLDPELADRIDRIAYNRVAVVALGYRRPDLAHTLDGFGYISPQRFRRDVLGTQWCSSIFEGRAPEGAVLLRALCGGWQRPEIVGWNDDRLLQAVREEMRLALGISATPIMHHIVRWDRAIPQYHLGHLERVAWIEARTACYPGLFLAGNAYRGVALNDCTEQGGEMAERIQAYVTARQKRGWDS